jgi:hypothetical protein
MFITTTRNPSAWAAAAIATAADSDSEAETGAQGFSPFSLLLLQGLLLRRDVIECGFPVRKKWFSELLHD